MHTLDFQIYNMEKLLGYVHQRVYLRVYIKTHISRKNGQINCTLTLRKENIQMVNIFIEIY